MTLDREKIAMKTVLRQLMKSEYGLRIDNNMLMLNFLSINNCTMVLKENTCVLRK